MSLEYFQPDAADQEVVAALERDGACVVLNQAPAETIDAVNADFRAPFDELGRLDEDDFSGYKTLRIAGILGISRAAADLVEHPPGCWLRPTRCCCVIARVTRSAV